MKKTLAVIMILLVGLVGCMAKAHTGEVVPRPPVSFPFAVHQAGATVSSKLLMVGKNHNYAFDLVFMFKEGDKIDASRVRKLVGGGGTINGRIAEPGIPIPLKLTITIIDSSGEIPFLEKEILVGKRSGHGSDRYYRDIDLIYMPPVFTASPSRA